jgi:hypothetical protein
MVEIRDFPGYINNLDSMDLPPGAGQTQVNVTSQIQGKLTVRKGYQIVKFED